MAAEFDLIALQRLCTGSVLRQVPRRRHEEAAESDFAALQRLCTGSVLRQVPRRRHEEAAESDFAARTVSINQIDVRHLEFGNKSSMACGHFLLCTVLNNNSGVGRRNRTLQPPRGAAWEPVSRQSQCRDVEGRSNRTLRPSRAVARNSVHRHCWRLIDRL